MQEPRSAVSSAAQRANRAPWPGKRRAIVLALAATGAALVACGRGSSGEAEPNASATLAPSAAPAPASGGPAGTASASAAGVAPTRSWKGTYKTAAAAVPVPSSWAKMHWSSPDATTAVGEGAMALSVDGATHRVTGTLDGPVGAAVIDGEAAGSTISASVRRKDPTDRGLTGTLLATTSDSAVTGTLSLASGDGNIVRTGTFTLAAAASSGASSPSPAPAPAPSTH